MFCNWRRSEPFSAEILRSSATVKLVYSQAPSRLLRPDRGVPPNRRLRPHCHLSPLRRPCRCRRGCLPSSHRRCPRSHRHFRQRHGCHRLPRHRRRLHLRRPWEGGPFVRIRPQAGPPAAIPRLGCDGAPIRKYQSSCPHGDCGWSEQAPFCLGRSEYAPDVIDPVGRWEVVAVMVAISGLVRGTRIGDGQQGTSLLQAAIDVGRSTSQGT